MYLFIQVFIWLLIYTYSFIYSYSEMDCSHYTLFLTLQVISTDECDWCSAFIPLVSPNASAAGIGTLLFVLIIYLLMCIFVYILLISSLVILFQ